jgi:hypothetical protein
MNGWRPRRTWTAPVPDWCFLIALWLVVTAVAVGLYVTGATY